MKLPARVRVRATGMPSVIITVEGALKFIDQLPPELAQLRRWTFARDLLVAALRTEKSRDIKTAVRQLEQALESEKWLDERPSS